jgi:nucleoside-diphosphate-sugar epimerase
MMIPRNRNLMNTNLSRDIKIVLSGGAGLVGQNLVVRLKERGFRNIVVVDKHKYNLNVLRNLHSDITTILADVSVMGDWVVHFNDADCVVMLQAQIGGIVYEEFEKNNVRSTALILDLIKSNPSCRLIHISSSVVNSIADDFYTQTKKQQEKLVVESGITCPILRPTLMFGWFDRKHLGWLARFMQKIPVFPIPGSGCYLRQPLYVGDFCNIIISCLENNIISGVYNISGREKIYYVDIIKTIRRSTGSSSIIVKIPYSLFYSLLWFWSKFDKEPPFTTQQLAALVAKDEFEIIDWPKIFNVEQTYFDDAIVETFSDPEYSKVVLEF